MSHSSFENFPNVINFMCYTFELKFFFPLFWPNLEIVTDRYHLYDSRAKTYVCKLNI